jgi:hypothetical protein
MKEVSQKNFGLVIAYVVPGLVVLWGVSYFSDTVKAWLSTANGGPPTVAGFLYVSLGSLAAGLTVGAIRSVTIDLVHHWTGLRQRELDFSDFQAKFWAFNQIVESHYRYYQFYAHMAIAMIFVFVVKAAMTQNRHDLAWPCVALGILEAVLIASSRGALRDYYSRAADLLGGERKT